jgi:hypothetical protein
MNNAYFEKPILNRAPYGYPVRRVKGVSLNRGGHAREQFGGTTLEEM